MHFWFQNLNDSKKNKRLFYFRGSVGSSWEKKWFSYELSSGPACRFTISTKDDGENQTLFALGLIFFTLYLTIPVSKLPLLKSGREYGFYWHEYILWMFWGRDPMSSSSKDPWYYNIVIHPLDILFGKTIHFNKELFSEDSPTEFEFRDQKYFMDEIKIAEAFWFKPRIPFSLYHTKRTRMHLEIKNPPKYSGKGENSWDCGDDATYGTTQLYTGPRPSYMHETREKIREHCCRVYCEGVLKNIERYGRASGDTLPKDYSNFKYIGRVKRDDQQPVSGVPAS